METLIEGIIAVVTENYEFAYGNGTMFGNENKHFLNFLTAGIMMEGSQTMVFNLIILCEFQVFD